MASAIFISYRRSDASAWAGRIYDALIARFPADQVFMDVDGIEPGADFAHVLGERIGSADVMLAVIGPRWLEAATPDGLPRLANPADFVRIEIETALKRGIRLIPLLVDGSTMPAPDQLPDPIRQLSLRNAVELSHTRFGSDTSALLADLQRIVGPPRRVGLAERLANLPSEGHWRHVLGLAMALGLDLVAVLVAIALMAPGPIGASGLSAGGSSTVALAVAVGTSATVLAYVLLWLGLPHPPFGAGSAILQTAAMVSLMALCLALPDALGLTQVQANMVPALLCSLLIAGVALTSLGRHFTRTGTQLALRWLSGCFGLSLFATFAATLALARTPLVAAEGAAIGCGAVVLSGVGLLILRRAKLSGPEFTVLGAGTALAAALVPLPWFIHA